jgi:Domain of unknown function (DUF4157)
MPAAHGGSVLTPAQVLHLQRAIGNQRVAELLQQQARVIPVGNSATSFGDGSGHPLEPSVRADVQSRFGYNLSRVRIHTDARAAASAQAMGAAAYTVGQDVSFAAGRYAPHTEPGRRLLAHELTHYVQQAGSAPTTVDASSAAPGATAAPSPGLGRAAEIEADDNAERIVGGASAQVNVAAPVGVAMKGAGDDSAAARSYWFQNKPPEKPIKTSSGIEITPKGQVVVDPAPVTIGTSRGTFQVRFAGLDSDFQGGKPTPAFAAAEKAVIAAIQGAIQDLGALPDIKGAESMEAALAQRKADETARARLHEAERTLHGRTLNIFIASELSVAERMSKAPLSLRTEQIYVRAEDIGDPANLEAAIRVPLVALTGGALGIAAGPGGKLKETTVRALTTEQAKEGILHEMLHVLLINKGRSAVQVWMGAKAGVVTGPDDVKRLAEDVLFRYVRAQEEIFVYSAIEGVYSGFAASKKTYELFAAAVEAFLKSIGAKLEVQKPRVIKVAEKIGEGKKKEGVTWSITYSLPKAVKVDAEQLDTLKTLQEFDIGS